MGVYDEPTKKCPYCGTEMTCDWVDVGVGSVQCGPYHCYNCYASEIGPELRNWIEKWIEPTEENPRWERVMKKGHPFSEEELKHGYYRGKISPYANTVKGVLVDHKTAKAAYNSGVLDDKDLPF